MAIIFTKGSPPAAGILNKLEKRFERAAMPKGDFRTVTMPDGSEVPASGPYSEKALKHIAQGTKDKIPDKVVKGAILENPAIIGQLPDSKVTTTMLSRVLEDEPQKGAAAVLQASLPKLNSMVDKGNLTADHIVSAFKHTVLPTPERFNSFCARVAPLLGKFTDEERVHIRAAADIRKKRSEELWARANESMKSYG